MREIFRLQKIWISKKDNKRKRWIEIFDGFLFLLAMSVCKKGIGKSICMQIEGISQFAEKIVSSTRMIYNKTQQRNRSTPKIGDQKDGKRKDEVDFTGRRSA